MFYFSFSIFTYLEPTYLFLLWAVPWSIVVVARWGCLRHPALYQQRQCVAVHH